MSAVWLWGAPAASGSVGYLLQFGSKGSGSGQFELPCCVAVDPSSSDVYVTDVHNNRVEKFDSSGRYLSPFGSAGLGVAVDSGGDVYVVGSRRVEKFDSSGKFLEAWGWGVADGASRFEICTSSCQGGIPGSGAGQFLQPQRVAVDPASGDVYVTDSSGNRVEKFDSSGHYLSQFGTTGKGAGQLNGPFGVAVAPSSGAVYVADLGNSRVEKFDSSGHYLSQFGRLGEGPAHFLGQPAGVAVSPSGGDVYVTEHRNNRVSEFDSSGKFLQAWGWGVADGARRFEICTNSCRVGISGSGAGQFSYGGGGGVDGVAVDRSSGDVYVADSNNNRVEKFTVRGPPRPVLGKSVDVVPVSGQVLIKRPGQAFVPLSEAGRLPAGTEIDSLAGSLKIITATGQGRKLQSGVFQGGIYRITQTKSGPQKGLTTLTLVEGAFPGAPTYSSCKAKASDTSAYAALSSRVLQTLRARGHGRFRTRGRYSAATVRGTVWDTIEQCNGTLTVVHRGTVAVTDFVHHKTILVNAGHRYLARPRQ